MSALGPGVFTEGSVLTGMSVLTEDANIFKNVIEIKGEVTLSVFTLFVLSDI